MKKLSTALVLTGVLFTGLNAATMDNGQINKLQKEVEMLQKQLKKQNAYIKKIVKKIKKMNKKQFKEKKKLTKRFNKIDKSLTKTKANHIMWNLDIKSKFDFIGYKLYDGTKMTNNILSNVITLSGAFKVDSGLKATVTLEANNIYGINGNTNISTAYYQNSNENQNWIANETPDDTTVRIKEAYFNVHFGPDDALMFSAGRRPSTGGFPANLRNGVNPKSPIAHTINMEFDGFSFLVPNSIVAKALPALKKYGSDIKFCLGRGYSPNTGKFSYYPYSKNEKITDFIGVMITPYAVDNTRLDYQYVYSWNMKGLNNGTMITLGDYTSSDVLFRHKGFGENKYLKDTLFFVSLAYSRTIPKDGHTMLGTTDAKSGYSVWTGLNLPAPKGRWGINYVHGTKYFRSMTWGEDTIIGSIAATRGNAYEVYYNYPLRKALSLTARATHILYNYDGSNGFFGDTGIPDVTGATIHKADNIRLEIKYSF